MSMTIDSAFIRIASDDFFSTNTIAELHISDRQQEKRYRNHNKDQIEHTTSSKCKLILATIDNPIVQNFTMISMSTSDSSRRRSGNHTVLPCAPQAVCAPLRVKEPDVFPSLHAKNCGEPLLV